MGFVAGFGWLVYAVGGAYIMWLDAEEWNAYCDGYGTNAGAQGC